jgi:hypothetical protein
MMWTTYVATVMRCMMIYVVDSIVRHKMAGNSRLEKVEA